MLARLSTEELLADVEAFPETSVKPLRRAAEPTQREYAIVWKHWTEYAARVRQPDLIPNVKWMKGFFKTLATERPGTLRERLSLNTLTAYATRLATAFRRNRGVKIDKEEVVDEVKDWLKKDLKKILGLSSALRPKPTADGQNLEILLHHLWAKDTHVFKWERTRIQLALYLMILAYTASRPGAVVVSDSYRNSNEALRYKDLKFQLSKDPETGEVLKSFTITFNLMKGDREDDDEFIKMTLWEDREHPHLCPVTLFLTLAFEDDAFDLEPENIFCDSLGRDVVEVEFKESVLDRPLFRTSKPSDLDKAWTYACCHAAVVELGFRAGYRTTVTSYAIRRGVANTLDKSATWAERGLILGQKNPRVLQTRYLNRHSEIDLQNLFHDKAGRTDRVRPLRTLTADYIPDAPDGLPKDVHQGYRFHPDYVALDEEYKSLVRTGADPAIYGKVRRKKDMLIARLRRKGKEKFRRDWFKNEGLQYLKQMNEPVREPGQDSSVELTWWRIAVVEALYNPARHSNIQRLELLARLRTLSRATYGYVVPDKHVEHDTPDQTRGPPKPQPRLSHCPYSNCRHKLFKSQKGLDRHLSLVHDREYRISKETQQKSESSVTRLQDWFRPPARRRPKMTRKQWDEKSPAIIIANLY